jgi:kynurenine formamidase
MTTGTGRRGRERASLAAGALPALALAACAAAPAPFPGGRLVDLSHAFGAETIYWPTEEGFALERGTAGVTEAGYYYEAHRFRGAEHGGTHVDAPIHFSAEGARVDEIPLARLVGEGALVDVTAACAANRDHRVSVADLERWEADHGRLPEASIVLIRTGFGARWPDRAAYLGTDERGAQAVAKLHFPGLHPEAARWLVAERRVRAVGIDTASIDHGPSRAFEAHRALSQANVPAFENLANLEALPARGFGVVALPMKIRAGSGAPLRIAAVVF